MNVAHVRATSEITPAFPATKIHQAVSDSSAGCVMWRSRWVFVTEPSCRQTSGGTEKDMTCPPDQRHGSEVLKTNKLSLKKYLKMGVWPHPEECWLGETLALLTHQCKLSAATGRFLLFTGASLCLCFDQLENWVFTQLKFLILKVLENVGRIRTFVGCTHVDLVTTDVLQEEKRRINAFGPDGQLSAQGPSIKFNAKIQPWKHIYYQHKKLQVEAKMTQAKNKNQQIDNSINQLKVGMSDPRWCSAVKLTLLPSVKGNKDNSADPPPPFPKWWCSNKQEKAV